MSLTLTSRVLHLLSDGMTTREIAIVTGRRVALIEKVIARLRREGRIQ